MSDPTRGVQPTRPWPTLVLLVLVACAVRPSAAPPPAPASLSALERAAELDRAASLAEVGGDRPEVRAALVDAGRAAPDWIVPQRELDQLDLASLRGPAVWTRRLSAVEARPADAVAQYLLGRLEGEAGLMRFRRALALDPGVAWAHHALSVDHELRGRDSAALASELEALRLARDPFARGDFARRAALLARRAGDTERARELLETAAEQLDGAAGLEVQLDLVQLELQASERETVERGFQRALTILREHRLDAEELSNLISISGRGLRGRSRDAYDLALVEALLEGPQLPGVDGGAAALVGNDPLTIAAAVRPDSSPPSPRRALRRAFDRGDYGGGITAWLDAQPAVVLTSDRMPRDARLLAVVEAAVVADRERPATLLPLCERLIEAGWDDLAAAVLEPLGDAAREGTVDADSVVALDLAARSISALVGELDSMVGALFDGSEVWALEPYDPDRPEASSRPGDLAEVLQAVERLVGEYGEAAGLEPELYADLDQSPRIRFGPFGAVVAPGPFFGERDAVMGIGEPGEPVPGLAAVADRLGRLALFGDGIGRSPDGTVLRRLWAEERSGEHLGAPWSGVVIWCGGADAAGARSRGPNQISGAALHEGYWIDVEVVRELLPRWQALRERFIDGDGDPAAVLAAPAAAVPERFEGTARRAERRRLVPPLGQGSRVALALMDERHGLRPESDGGPLVTLDELLEVVQVHEEGHLCDRERFLPFGRNFGALLLLLLREAAGDLGVERRAEYRAQAVALACVSEPRLALIELLDSAEVDTRRYTIHAYAYRRLLEDFLMELDRQLHAEPEAWPALDGERYLVHQLHRLSGEQVRRIAVEVARREGLVADRD